MKRLTIKVTVESVRTYGSTEHTGEASFSLDFSTEVSVELQEQFIGIMPILISAAGESHLESIDRQAKIERETEKNAQNLL